MFTWMLLGLRVRVLLYPEIAQAEFRDLYGALLPYLPSWLEVSPRTYFIGGLLIGWVLLLISSCTRNIVYGFPAALMGSFYLILIHSVWLADHSARMLISGVLQNSFQESLVLHTPDILVMLFSVGAFLSWKIDLRKFGIGITFVPPDPKLVKAFLS